MESVGGGVGGGSTKIPPRQDRTGFIEFFALSGVLIVLSLLSFYYQYNKTSMLLGVVGVIAFITAEGISRPPRMGPHEFVKKREEICKKQHEMEEEVLVCLGDSLTHGACSANWVDTIVPNLRNAGQNSICTETVLKKKVEHVIACQPNSIFIMIGTNDVRAIYRKDWADDLIRMWSLTERPSEDALVRNLTNIINELIKCTGAMIAVGTLPPLGEDANSNANQIIGKVNKCIVRAIEKDSCDSRRVSIVDVNGALWKHINKSSAKRTTIHSVDNFLITAIAMGTLHHIFGLHWNTLTRLITGNVVLSESLHLNETGGDVIRDEVVKWLLGNVIGKNAAGGKKKSN